MSLRHYGIYLAYPPTVDMRDQGLGRYLAAFIKGAAEDSGLRFTLVCPSWSHDALEQLFSSEGLARGVVQVVAPQGKPYALRLYEAWKTRRERVRRKGLWHCLVKWLVAAASRLLSRLERRVVEVHGVPSLLVLLTELLPLTLLLLLILPVSIPIFLFQRFLTRLLRKFSNRLAGWHKVHGRLSALLAMPKSDSLVIRLFAHMQKLEAARMQHLISTLSEVSAWYCPTAFWPSFNEINTPRLMCVPDVVLQDFSVGFSGVGGDRFLDVFEMQQQAIRSADQFVTYSAAVKWDTLVDRYGIAANKISVIHHAPNDLGRWVAVKGFHVEEATSRHYCQTLLRAAMQRSNNPAYASGFLNGDVKFLFYASQFRPNKNVITLLRAYEHLLRKRYLGHKLVLTGRSHNVPEIERFIVDHNLENDVLCLPGLSVPELAACYKLADLAVNPSLSEGGCPFTFTEALSVGTPVVMARIEVSEEVLFEPEVQEVCFFDPYDWEDVAERIEWALSNRAHLLKIETAVYQRLKQRTWKDVAQEHIAILDRLIECQVEGVAL
jgi:glycosyltransferase involved in cell wall biosynthesis